MWLPAGAKVPPALEGKMSDDSLQEQIYVALLDEGVDVWRPVSAERISEGIYRISQQPYDRDTERWEFEPGALVVAEIAELGGGPALVARRRA
jgi:hypothetical protein